MSSAFRSSKEQKLEMWESGTSLCACHAVHGSDSQCASVSLSRRRAPGPPVAVGNASRHALLLASYASAPRRAVLTPVMMAKACFYLWSYALGRCWVAPPPPFFLSLRCPVLTSLLACQEESKRLENWPRLVYHFLHSYARADRECGIPHTLSH